MTRRHFSLLAFAAAAFFFGLQMFEVTLGSFQLTTAGLFALACGFLADRLPG